MFKKMCILIAAFLFVLFTNGNAQLAFNRRVMVDNIPRVWKIYPIDLDCDGDMDIVGGASLDTRKVYWIENLGAGNFIFHLVDGAANGVYNGGGIFACDLNSDGFIDIIASLTKPSGPVYDNEVAWYENDGHQGFTKHRIYSFGQPDYVFANDLDEDGDNDVLATFWGIPDNGQAVWFENDGSGHFTNHIIVDNYQMGRSIISADFDGDGDKDVVTTAAYLNARMDWWKNDGNENFVHCFAETRMDCMELGTYDFNNDGTSDLLYPSILSGYAKGEVAWFSWLGSNPTKHIIESTTTEAGFAHCSWATDLDNDGDLDVLATNGWNYRIYYYLRTPGGYSKYVLDCNSGKGDYVVTADFDNDGDADVATAAHNDGKIYWYENLLNLPPVANAGTDQTIEATSPSGAGVTLDGSGSYDPDDDPLTYTWRENSTIIAGPTSSPTSPVTLALGSHIIELTVDDGKGGTDADQVVVTIVDTTPPTLTVNLQPNVLWPPNHKMIAIHATVTVSDAVDPNPAFVLTSIESNEPDNGLGDGDKPNDIQGADFGAPDIDFKLRAERSGTGKGRIYTVTYTAMDVSGNNTSTSAMVTVPHDMGQANLAPASFNLFTNYPNPFNQATEISFQLPATEHTVLKIFNALGQEIKTLIDQKHETGYHTVRWDGRDNIGNLWCLGLISIKSLPVILLR